MQKSFSLSFLLLFSFTPVFAQQTGNCDAGTQYCEANSLNTVNTTTTSSTNTNTNNNTNTSSSTSTSTNTNTNNNTNINTSTNTNTNINTNNQALTRVRAGGSVAPAKKGAVANTYRSGGHGSIYAATSYY